MANRGYLEQSSIRPEDAIGRHCYLVSHGFDRPCPEAEGSKCPVLETFKTGRPSRAVHIHRDKDGKELYVAINSFPIKNGAGEIVQVVETINDVTDKKKADDELAKRIKELEAFYDMAVGRELRMRELKEEMERLREELGRVKR